MNGPRSAIVFFSYPDADDEKEDAVRQQTLARGTDEILANVPGLRVMNDHQVTCNPEWIELFLRQQLSDDEQAAFETHLSDCADCRIRLEAAAASDDIWSGVRRSLIHGARSGR